MMAVVLAAGHGKRMKSKVRKVYHRVLGVPILERIVRVLHASGLKVCVVLSPDGEKYISDFRDKPDCVVYQDVPLGTGHALKVALESGSVKDENILVLPGDLPLLRVDTIGGVLGYWRETGWDALVVAMMLDDPGRYGRVKVREDGSLAGIVEWSDATEEERAIKLVNTGVYVLKRSLVVSLLDALKAENAQGEYYLTDIFGLLVNSGYAVGVVVADDPTDFMGVNTRHDLAMAEEVARRRKIEELMDAGVTIHMPDTVYVEEDVELGRDTEVWPNTIIKGVVKAGEECVLGPGAYIEDSEIGNRVRIEYSHVVGAYVGDDSVVGPFGRLRPGARLEGKVKIGNFVEVKKSVLGYGTKASHLSYIGDATVGRNVNIGAGTITCNYDGFKKNPTYIGDDVFIGSDSILVAPVRIGKGAYTAAGSVITEDVPPGALAIGRARQINKEGWVEKYRARKMEELQREASEDGTSK